MTFQEILQRSQSDFIFYARNFLKIRDFNDRMIPFSLNSIQRDILFKAYADSRKKKIPLRVIQAKARRMGASTLWESLIFWRVVFSPLVDAIILSHDLESGKYIFNMCNLFYDELPPSLRPSRKRSNVRELYFATEDPDHPGLRSRIYVETAKNAQIGRAKQLRYFHGSEVAYWDEAKASELMLAVEQSVPEKTDTMIIYESTGNGAGGTFYDRFMKAYTHPEQSIWQAIFVPWFLLAEYQIPLEPGETVGIQDREDDFLVKEFQLAPEQLKWRHYTIQNKCQGDLDMFHKEYPSTVEEAFIYSVSNVFPLQILRGISQYLERVSPVFVGELTSRGLTENRKGGLKIFQYPQPGHTYGIGADVSEGSGLDNSCAQVIDCLNMEQAAEWTGVLDPDLFADVLYYLGLFYNTARIAVECNNHGLTTITTLRNMGYKNMYRRISFDYTTAKKVPKLGWLTSSRTKPLMEDKLLELLREGDFVLNSRECLEEMSCYVRGLNGKTGAIIGRQDDRVIALMIAVQAALGREGIRRGDRGQSIRSKFTIGDFLEMEHTQRLQANYAQRSLGKKKKIVPLAFGT